MITENLSTLQIHKLSEEQYERELAAGRTDPFALYLTPEEDQNFVVTITKENDNATFQTSANYSTIFEEYQKGKTIYL